LSLSQVIFKFRNCNSTPKKNHCSQHSIIIKVPWPFQHMSIEQLINFEIFISWNKIFLKIQYFCSLYFVIWKKFILKISAFLLNNIINVEVAKVGGVLLHFEMKFSIISPSKKCIIVPWPFQHMSIE
jgi:hypothetical protein